MTPFPSVTPFPSARGRRRSTPVAPSMPAGWPHGAMPVLFLLSLISRNPPKQLGVVSPELLPFPSPDRHLFSDDLLCRKPVFEQSLRYVLWPSGWSLGVGSWTAAHARAEPNRRLIIEFTVSTCHLCPYFRLYRPNRCFIRRRQRPNGSLSVGRPRGRDDRPNAVRPDTGVDPLGVEVRVGQERFDPGTADCLPSAAPNCTRSEPGPRPGTAARIMWLLQSTTKTTFGYLA